MQGDAMQGITISEAKRKIAQVDFTFKCVRIISMTSIGGNAAFLLADETGFAILSVKEPENQLELAMTLKTFVSLRCKNGGIWTETFCQLECFVVKEADVEVLEQSMPLPRLPSLSLADVKKTVGQVSQTITGSATIRCKFISSTPSKPWANSKKSGSLASTKIADTTGSATLNFWNDASRMPQFIEDQAGLDEKWITLVGIEFRSGDPKFGGLFDLSVSGRKPFFIVPNACTEHANLTVIDRIQSQAKTLSAIFAAPAQDARYTIAINIFEVQRKTINNDDCIEFTVCDESTSSSATLTFWNAPVWVAKFPQLNDRELIVRMTVSYCSFRQKDKHRNFNATSQTIITDVVRRTQSEEPSRARLRSETPQTLQQTESF